MIDDGLGIIRKLWDAGLAHRDIKPANLLVRDGRLLLIDVAFVEARPSPWRQAVDLANMMLCLALRSSPERVYRRALQYFTVEEITEGFAAARGLALPSQLRHMLRAQGRDLHAEFIRLLPTPPQPIRIQRWSARRIGLWAAILALVVLAALNPQFALQQRGRCRDPAGGHDNVGCDDLEPLWLMAQSVPSASLVPCVRSLPVGWTVAEVAVNNGRSLITLDHDRAGDGALVVRLTAACDPERRGGGAVRDGGRAPLPANRVAHRRVRRHLVRPVPRWLCHQPAAPDERPQRGVRRPGATGAGVHHPRGAPGRRSASAPTGDSSWTPRRHDEPAEPWRGRWTRSEAGLW